MTFQHRTATFSDADGRPRPITDRHPSATPVDGILRGAMQQMRDKVARVVDADAEPSPELRLHVIAVHEYVEAARMDYGDLAAWHAARHAEGRPAHAEADLAWSTTDACRVLDEALAGSSGRP